MDNCCGYRIVCPDGKRRHLPYHNEGDAKSDAEFLSDGKPCLDPNVPNKVTDCPGGKHTVEPVVFEHEDLDGEPHLL